VFFDGEEALLPDWGGTDHTYGSRHYVAEARRTGSLASLKAFVLADMVADRDLRIRVWNGLSQEQWGLRADETEGRTLVSLDIGLPVAQLTEPIRRCLTGESTHEEVHVDAVSRRGRSMHARVRISPLLGQDKEIVGVIVLTDDVLADAPSD